MFHKGFNQFRKAILCSTKITKSFKSKKLLASYQLALWGLGSLSLLFGIESIHFWKLAEFF